MTRHEPTRSEDAVLQKADFGAIYGQPDPRDYFTTLSAYDYRIPEEGARVLRHLAKAGIGIAEPTILDVCCSYGIVSLMLKTDATMQDLFRHYGPESADLSSAEMREADVAFLTDHANAAPIRVIGLDIARNAVEYSVSTGALDGGFVENLESDEPSEALVEAVASVDLITCTGGVGYVTEKTFSRLVAAAPPSTHVAAFCLRTYDYDSIAAALAERGLVTERASRTFRQRRFVDADEQRWAFDKIRALGGDPEGVESDGYYHANFYLSRPAAEVEARPLEELLAD